MGEQNPIPPLLLLGIEVSVRTIHAFPPGANMLGYTHVTLEVPYTAATYSVKRENATEVLSLITFCGGHVPIPQLQRWATAMSTQKALRVFQPGMPTMLVIHGGAFIVTNSPGVVVSADLSSVGGVMPSRIIEIETLDRSVHDRMADLFIGGEAEVHAP